jgi:hypothetical protein
MARSRDFRGGLSCAVLALTLLPGCGCCGNTTLGNPSEPIQLEITAAVQNPDGTVDYIPVGDAGPLQLVRGGQGFQMVAMNVRATNLDRCGVTVSGQLIEPDGGPDDSDYRIADLSDVKGDGWGSLTGGLSSSITLPPFDESCGVWAIDAGILDAQGRSASAQATFTLVRLFPECPDAGP